MSGGDTMRAPAI